jgi:hypothetical protein
MNIKNELRAALLKEGKHKTHKNEYGCLMVYLDVDKKDWNKLQNMIDDEDLYLPEDDPSYGRETEPHATILFGFHEDVPDEDIEKEFEDYLNSFKWQLIQTKIFKDSDTKLVYEEVLAFTKGLIISNYAQYGIPAPEDAELEASARELLTKKEQANSIYDQLAEEKLTQYFKTNASLKMKPLSYDDFLAEMKK